MPVDLVVLGDSSAAGVGADSAHETVGAIVASGVAALTGRRVRLTNTAVVGAESSDLERQLANALEEVVRPDVVVIMVGGPTTSPTGSSARHRCGRSSRPCAGSGPSARRSSWAPARTSGPSSRSSSRCVAHEAVVARPRGGPDRGRRRGRRADGVARDLLGPEFDESPHEMFSKDRFHPSAAGYAAAAALLPSVCAALGVWGADTSDRAPEARRGEGVGPVAVAAGQAVKGAGRRGRAHGDRRSDRGPRGRWAGLLRRRHDEVPPAEDARGERGGRAGDG